MGRLRANKLTALMAGALLCVSARAKDYPSTFDKAAQALKKGDMKEITKIYQRDAEKERDKDKLLCQYELAAMFQMLGDPKTSMRYFAEADDLAHIYEGRAVVSGNMTARVAGSMLANDKILMYEGPAFEKVMSRTLNALNYLLVADLEGARVEIRKAEEYQDLERTKHQKELDKAEAESPQDQASQQAASEAGSSELVQQQIGPMANYAAKVRNSFENAFTYYLSGLVYEAAGGPDAVNDAHVDFKRAFELAPDSPAVREAYLDSARRFDATEYRTLTQQLGVQPSGPPEGSGTVTVLFEQGFVPEKRELRLDLPVRVANRIQIVPLAFPVYNTADATPASPLKITVSGQEYTTSPVLDVRPIAVKALVEKLPGIITRAVARGIAKTAVESNAEQRGGSLFGLATKLWAVLSTRADLRGWYSLPAEVEAARIYLPAGNHRFEFAQSDFSDQASVDVAPGGSYILVVRAVPGFHKIMQAVLSQPAGAPPASASEGVQAMGGAPAAAAPEPNQGDTQASQLGPNGPQEVSPPPPQTVQSTPSTSGSVPEENPHVEATNGSAH